MTNSVENLAVTNNRRAAFGRFLIPAAVAAAYCVGVVWFAQQSYLANDAHFVYALDDPYIHMAVARNIVERGVHGATPYEFCTASSSPLWTVLLTGSYFVFGAMELAPLAMNALFGAAVLFAAWMLGKRAGLTSIEQFILLVGLAVLTPLIPISFTGLEHTLHIFLVFAWMYFIWPMFSDEKPSRSELAGLALATALAVAARYETLFLIAPALLILFFKRRWRAGFVCGAGAFATVFAFGLFSVLNGGEWLPNTLLIKGNSPAFGTFSEIVESLGGRAYDTIRGNQYMLDPMIGLSLFFIWRRILKIPCEALDWLVLIVLSAIVIHAQLANVGCMFRYDAYLAAIAYALLILLLGDMRGRGVFRHPRRLAAATCTAASVLLLWSSAIHAKAAHEKIIIATKNIYEQQYQMAEFLGRYYDGAAVAANDIGAINYFNDLRCLDLVGLGSQEVAFHKINGNYTTDVIRRISNRRGVRIALVYRSWFQGEESLPNEWIPIGEWVTLDNYICGDNRVLFLAVDPFEAERLAANLAEFQDELPDGVISRKISPAKKLAGRLAIGDKKGRKMGPPQPPFNHADESRLPQPSS